MRFDDPIQQRNERDRGQAPKEHRPVDVFGVCCDRRNYIGPEFFCIGCVDFQVSFS